MNAARISFAVSILLMVGLSVAALWHVGGNRMQTDRQCQIYETWKAWDKTGEGGSFGPLASMESKCADTWLARLNRKAEWGVPWR